MTKKKGVYGIYNTSENKWYVGSSIDVESRLNGHVSAVKERTGIFKGINKKSAFQYLILKTINNRDSLELWENYFIGFYNSIENGYNKRLAARRPTLSIIQYLRSDSEICIMTETEIFSLLRVTSMEDCTAVKEKIPHIIISNNTKRYEKIAVINFLLKESKLNEYSSKLESETLKQQEAKTK